MMAGVDVVSVSSESDRARFATYQEVRDIPNHPEKLLIDVREPHELAETGVIPSSINMPLKTVLDDFNLSASDFLGKYQRAKPTTDTEIIFTCRSGKRAQDACDALRKLGFKNVKNYKGSWIEWAEKDQLYH